jgi:hypothetical protein
MRDIEHWPGLFRGFEADGEELPEWLAGMAAGEMEVQRPQPLQPLRADPAPDLDQT